MKKLKYYLFQKISKDYKSASYQFDFFNSLKKISILELYGPGTTMYNKSDSINEILKKINFLPEIIFIGHNWLSDNENHFNIPNNLNLTKTKIKKLFFLIKNM